MPMQSRRRSRCPAQWRERCNCPIRRLRLTQSGLTTSRPGLHAAGKSPRRRHVGTIGISVHDDFQHHGAGSALLSAALDIADNWIGYTRVELTVYTDNEAAIALYRKAGFAIEGSARRFALRNGEYVDAHMMTRITAGPAGGLPDNT